MADETDIDMDMELDREALDRALAADHDPLQGSIGGADLSHAGPMGPELTEALSTSSGRPSDSYEALFPNWAVEGSKARKVPGRGLACVTCPEAVWMSGGEDLQAFCRILRAMTWSAKENVPMLIEICNGKEMAIVALLEQQTRRELKDSLQPSR